MKYKYNRVKINNGDPDYNMRRAHNGGHTGYILYAKRDVE